MNDTRLPIPSFIPKNETLRIENWNGDIIIPDNLVVHGTLELINCPNVGSFSDNVLLLGDISLQNSSVTRLPKRCMILGNLDIQFSNVCHIPEIIAVSGDITVFGCMWHEMYKDRFIVKGETIGA